MGRDQENKLFIGGLSYSTEDKSLREYFERFGPLSDYVVMRYPDTTRRSRGFGFVSFDNKADMENCLASQPHNLDGRTVELKQATPKEDMGGGRSGGFSSRRGDDDEEAADPEGKLMRKLFIGGLNYTTTEAGMKEYFEKYGRLEDCVVMKFPDSGRSRGFGFITYESSYMVDDCQRERPHTLDGRSVECKRATPKSQQSNPEAQASVKKIFVGNVIEEMKDSDIEEYFAKFGNVSNVQQMKWNDTGKKRGFGFVEFDDTDAVDKICLLGKHFLLGKRLEVRKALSKSEMAMIKKAKEGDDGGDSYGGRGRESRGGGDRYGGSSGGGGGGYGMSSGMGNQMGNMGGNAMGMGMGGGGMGGNMGGGMGGNMGAGMGGMGAGMGGMGAGMGGMGAGMGGGNNQMQQQMMNMMGGANSGMNPMMMMQMMMNMMGGGGANMMGGGGANMMGGGAAGGASTGAGAQQSSSAVKTESKQDRGGYGGGAAESGGQSASYGTSGYGGGSGAAAYNAGAYGYGGGAAASQDPVQNQMNQMMANQGWGNGGGWGQEAAKGGTGGGPMRGASRENAAPYNRR